MELSETSKLYNEHYYAHGCGPAYQRDDHWLTFFGSIAEKIVAGIQPTTVLDAGCAMGFLVEQLRVRGVDTWGVDISEYAVQNVHESIREYVWVGSITEPFPRKYDLITTIEVLEHLPQGASEQALINLCQHTDDILFSSTPFDYEEATHFNVQPVEYWAELFAQQSFYRDVDFDPSFITPWAVRFRRKQQTIPRVTRNYERWAWLTRKENIELHERVSASENTIKAMTIELESLRAAEHRLKLAEAQAAIWEEQQKTAGWKLLQKVRGIINPVAAWYRKNTGGQGS